MQGQIQRFLDPDGKTVRKIPDLSRELLLKMYRTMRLVRHVDERMMNLQRQGRIGFYGPSTGEEGAAIGSAAALLPEDWVFPALRQGGVLLYRGMSVLDYVCQVLGNSRDIHKGHQMPCHYSHREFRHVAWSSSMATQLPHAVGTAYGARFRQDRTVVMAYLGDGATSEGDFHVAMNFAAVWKVPVVFFCHNNQWAISVPFEKQTASRDIVVKAAAYGMEGKKVDGNDVLACYHAARSAVEKARQGGGPTLIEAVTYRMGPHTTSDDPRLYRDQAEVEAWKGRDPIERLRRFLEHAGLWNSLEEERLAGELHNEVSLAIEEAEKIPLPDLPTLFEDTYAQTTRHLMEQAQESFEIRWNP